MEIWKIEKKNADTTQWQSEVLLYIALRAWGLGGGHLGLVAAAATFKRGLPA